MSTKGGTNITIKRLSRKRKSFWVQGVPGREGSGALRNAPAVFGILPSKCPAGGKKEKT